MVDLASELCNTRPHTDAELLEALRPFAADHVARLRADRERHGAAAATIMAASRMARFYSMLHVICEDAIDAARTGGVP